MTFWPLTAGMIFLAVSMNASAEDDRSLSIRIRQGDHSAFRQFFNRHYDALFRFLTGHGIDKAAAEDLIQRAFIIIWEKRKDIDASKSLRAYLYRTAYTRMLNDLKYHSRFSDGNELPISDGQPSPEEDLQLSQIMDVIHKTVAQMPEKRKAVFDFCFMRQFTYKETADILQISVKTIENHMTLALKDVRRSLAIFRQRSSAFDSNGTGTSIQTEKGHPAHQRTGGNPSNQSAGGNSAGEANSGIGEDNTADQQAQKKENTVSSNRTRGIPRGKLYSR